MFYIVCWMVMRVVFACVFVIQIESIAMSFVAFLIGFALHSIWMRIILINNETQIQQCIPIAFIDANQMMWWAEKMETKSLKTDCFPFSEKTFGRSGGISIKYRFQFKNKRETNAAFFVYKKRLVLYCFMQSAVPRPRFGFQSSFYSVQE